MTLVAFDGASPFDLNAAKRAGAVIITGYIVGHPGGMDPIDKARVDQIRALGMGFLPNWERGADYLVHCGHAGGVQAGQETVAALRALGVPDNGTVECAFSWDTNIDPSLYPQCGQVADGIIAGLAGHYLFTAYGQGGLIDYLRQTGRLQADGWLSGSTGFYGYNSVDVNVALVQHAGPSPVPGTDLDTVTDPANVRAWWPDGSPYAQEADMPLSPADAELVADAVWRRKMARPGNDEQWAWLHLVDTSTNAAIAATQAHIAATQNGATTLDPTATAAAIVAAAGPNLAQQIAAAIGAALAKGTTQ